MCHLASLPCEVWAGPAYLGVLQAPGSQQRHLVAGLPAGGGWIPVWYRPGSMGLGCRPAWGFRPSRCKVAEQGVGEVLKD